MCDYCGWRSESAIAALGAEHERLGWVAGVVERALASDETAGAQRTFAELVGLLAAHTATEEAGLFAELLAAGELTGPVAERCAERDEISAAIDAALEARPDPARWEAAARPGLEQLAEHIWREETDMFPAAALALSTIALGATVTLDVVPMPPAVRHDQIHAALGRLNNTTDPREARPGRHCACMPCPSMPPVGCGSR